MSTINSLIKCVGKSAYSTREKCEQIAARRMKQDPTLSLRVYQCDNGLHYHMTKKPNWEKYAPVKPVSTVLDLPTRKTGEEIVEGFLDELAAAKLLEIEKDKLIANIRHDDLEMLMYTQRDGVYKFNTLTVQTLANRFFAGGRLTIKEAAEAKNMPYSSFYKHVNKGTIPHFTFLGQMFVRKSELERFEAPRKAKTKKVVQVAEKKPTQSVFMEAPLGGIESKTLEYLPMPKPKSDIKSIVVMLIEENNLKLAHELLGWAMTKEAV